MNRMALIIRAARSTDAAPLSQLALAAKAYWGYDKEFLDSCRDELTFTAEDVVERNFIVGQVNNEIVGFYAIGGVAPIGNLAHLWLNPSRIGSGLGRALWEHAMKSAAASGFTSLNIDADPNAEGFYIKMGAKLIGYTPSGSIEGRMLPLLSIDVKTVTEMR